MKPQMLPNEIVAIEKILLSHAPKLDILEWGSGGSTVYFTKFLRKRHIPYSLLSIEYNKKWFHEISGAVETDPNTRLVLFDVGNDYNKQPTIPMDEYVAYPATLGKKYDVIIIDGRKRRRCLLEASKLLKPNGDVLLHDARRTHYHSAFSAFPDSRMLLWSGLWLGRLVNPGIFKRAVNMVSYWCFRVYTASFRLRSIFK